MTRTRREEPAPTRSRRSLSRRTWAFLAATAALAAWAGYDAFLHRGYTLGAWLATPLDWLFLLAATVFAFFVAWPLAVNPPRTARYWRRFSRHPLSVAALCVLVVFVAVGALGPVLLPAPSLDFTHAYQPPVFASTDATHVSACVGRVADGVCHGSWRYPLGTDRNGYPMGRVLVSALHVSLYLVAITSMLVAPLALAVGTTAGYVGGLADSVLMRYVEVQDTIPAVVVYLLLVFWYGKSLLLVVVLFGFLSWGGVARLVRSDVRQRATEEFVLAGYSLGGSDAHVVRTHVLPNVANTAVTATMQRAPLLVLTEAGLAFLGLEGFDVPSFGNVVTRGIATSDGVAFLGKWWVSTEAALALAVVVLALKLAGDAARDALDPRP